MIRKENIKNLRRELKQLGYRLKTESFSINKCFASIYLNDLFVYGTGANVYTEEVFKTHKNAINIFKKYEV